MSALSAIWNLFFEVLSWIFYPSSSNPVIHCIGVFMVSAIALYFLGVVIGIRGYKKHG